MKHHECGATKECRKCKEVKPVTEFHRNKRQKDGFHYYCKECNKAHAKAGYHKNHEKNREVRKAYHERMKDDPAYKQAVYENVKRWKEENREAVNVNAKRWRDENPEKTRGYIKAQAANRKAALIKRRLKMEKATPAWADMAAMQAFYDEAQRLTAETGEQYHVDHIIPLQGETVTGLHCEANLQVIPAAENIRKGNRLKI